MSLQKSLDNGLERHQDIVCTYLQTGSLKLRFPMTSIRSEKATPTTTSHLPICPNWNV